MTGAKLSPAQKKIAELLIEAHGGALSLDELVASTGLNKGALTKALAAIRGWSISSDGRDAYFGPGTVHDFGEYDASGIGPNFLRYWETKNAAAILGAELLVGQLRGTQCLAFDNGTTVAAFYRHFCDRIDALKPNRPQLSIVSLNPVVASEALRRPHDDKIVVIGGRVDMKRCSILGDSVVRSLREDDHQFDWAIISVARASVDGTLGQPTEDMLDQKEELIRRSSHVLVLLNEEKILARPDKGCRPLFKLAGSTLERIVALEHAPTVTLVIAVDGAGGSGFGRQMFERVKATKNVSVHLADSEGNQISPEDPRRSPPPAAP